MTTLHEHLETLRPGRFARSNRIEKVKATTLDALLDCAEALMDKVHQTETLDSASEPGLNARATQALRKLEQAMEA